MLSSRENPRALVPDGDAGRPAPFRTAQQQTAGHPDQWPYLDTQANRRTDAMDTDLDVLLRTGLVPEVISRSSAAVAAFWTHTVNGCGLSAVDLFGSGTLSCLASARWCSMAPRLPIAARRVSASWHACVRCARPVREQGLYGQELVSQRLFLDAAHWTTGHQHGLVTEPILLVLQRGVAPVAPTIFMAEAMRADTSVMLPGTIRVVVASAATLP